MHAAYVPEGLVLRQMALLGNNGAVYLRAAAPAFERAKFGSYACNVLCAYIRCHGPDAKVARSAPPARKAPLAAGCCSRRVQHHTPPTKSVRQRVHTDQNTGRSCRTHNSTTCCYQLSSHAAGGPRSGGRRGGTGTVTTTHSSSAGVCGRSEVIHARSTSCVDMPWQQQQQQHGSNVT